MMADQKGYKMLVKVKKLCNGIPKRLAREIIERQLNSNVVVNVNKLKRRNKEFLTHDFKGSFPRKSSIPDRVILDNGICFFTPIN